MRGATLIVLAWNQWHLTKRCLDSLLASSIPMADVVVVDNGSTDGTSEGMREYTGRVRYLAMPENLGFVRGMNAGIAASRHDDDIVLLNNDLVFLQHDWLERLRDAAYSAADVGVVGCRMLGPAPRQLVYHVGGFIEPEGLWGQQTESGHQERDAAQFPRTRRVQGIAFALAYLRRDAIERIGVLDERFHSYFEDTDYCLRAREAGIACVVAGKVTLRHDQHGSTADDGGFRDRLWQASRGAFAERWQARLLARRRGCLEWRGQSRLPHAAAQLTRSLLPRLEARDLRMLFSPVARELAATEDFRVELSSRRPRPARTDATLVVGVDPAQARLPSAARPRIALLWSEWESPPRGWIDACAALDHLLVTDAFQAEAFRAAGFDRTIDVLDPGIDREYFHPDVPAPHRRDERLVFLAIAECLERDGSDTLVSAFQQAFDARDPVELVVHIAPGDDEARLHERLARLVDPARAKVRLLYGWGFPSAERAQLHAAADVYVSARRGLGRDHALREALACARVIVAPATGSQRDLVAYGLQPVATTGPVDDPDHPGCRWHAVDAEALRDTLRAVRDHHPVLARDARAHALRFASHHHADAAADRLAEVVTNAAGMPARIEPAPHAPSSILPATASGQIVVLGMHRSGTSSIGGVLHLLGAWAGPDELLLKGPDNPKGHFEHGELHMACVRRLAAAGGDWRSPPDEVPPEATDAFRREAATVLDTLEPRRPWFIKEPRLCLFARELLPLLTRPVFVHVVREPGAVARSLARRDAMSATEALALWERYTRDAFDATHGWKRIIVDYDALVASPLATTQALHDALADAGVQGLSMPDEASIRAWIEPSGAAMETSNADLAFTPAQAELRDRIADRSILSAVTS